MYTLTLIGVSMIVSLIITPIVIAVSKKLDIVDKPNFRKIHTKPISMLGGTAILLSFLIGVWLGHPIEREIKPLLLGAIVMYFVGLIDDL
ncbi:undecaprenyl-phosphate alpha-N-acetylglucosaminyl 1-phosphate transferase, partial [Staphylococcus pseudintermedius]